MRRFTRKNSSNKSQDEPTPRRMKTQMDQPNLDSSMSTTKNRSFDQQSVDRKEGRHKSGTFLIFALWRSVVRGDLEYGFARIRKVGQRERLKIRGIPRIANLTGKLLYKLKSQSFTKIKSQQLKVNSKKKSLTLLASCTAGVERRLKMMIFLRIVNQCKRELSEDCNELKQIQGKYNEIVIPEEQGRQLRRFVKAHAKNVKAFLRNSQQIVEPVLQSLAEMLQTKRIRKSVPSDTETLISALKNYIYFLKELHEKLESTQSQLRTSEQQKTQLQSELEMSQTLDQNRDKELKRYDTELQQKLVQMVDGGFSVGSVRAIERVMEQQVKMCEGKVGGGYEYVSRVGMLRLGLTVVRKLYSCLDAPQSSPQATNRSNKSSSGRKKSDTIEQQSSIQQSDLMEHIASILDQLITELKNEPKTLQILKQTLSHSMVTNRGFIVDGRVKNVYLPELSKLDGKFREIFNVFGERVYRYLELEKEYKRMKQQLIASNQQLNKQLQQNALEFVNLNKKISQLQSKIHSQQLHHLEQLDQAHRTSQQQHTILQQTIMSITRKLDDSLAELQLKDLEIETLNCRYVEKDKKVHMLNEEFSRFRKLMKGWDRGAKERDRSVDDIVERSLSKGKESISNSRTKNTNNNNQSKNKSLIGKSGGDVSIVGGGGLGVKSPTNSNNKYIWPRAEGKKEQLTLAGLELNSDSASLNQAQQTKKISHLTSELQQAHIEINNHLKKIQNLQYQNSTHLLPQNVITLLYNIIIKLEQLGKDSDQAIYLWNELKKIEDGGQIGVGLLVRLEEFVIGWLSKSIKEREKVIKEEGTPKKEAVLNLDIEKFKTAKSSKWSGIKQ